MLNPKETSFELAVLFGKPVLFSNEQVDTIRLPEGIHAYEIRHIKTDPATPLWIGKQASQDYFGTILSKEPINLTDEHVCCDPQTHIVKLARIREDDFKMDDGAMATIQDYIDGQYQLTPQPEKDIRVVVVHPWERPYETVISNELKPMQEIVGGLIQAIYPFTDPAAIVCNEEGKIIGLPLNRRIGDDIIAGTFIICGLDDRTSSFASLTSEQVKRYMGMFSTVELYVGSARPEIKHYKAHKVKH